MNLHSSSRTEIMFVLCAWFYLHCVSSLTVSSYDGLRACWRQCLQTGDNTCTYIKMWEYYCTVRTPSNTCDTVNSEMSNGKQYTTGADGRQYENITPAVVMGTGKSGLKVDKSKVFAERRGQIYYMHVKYACGRMKQDTLLYMTFKFDPSTANRDCSVDSKGRLISSKPGQKREENEGRLLFIHGAFSTTPVRPTSKYIVFAIGFTFLNKRKWRHGFDVEVGLCEKGKQMLTIHAIVETKSCFSIHIFPNRIRCVDIPNISVVRWPVPFSPHCNKLKRLRYLTLTFLLDIEGKRVIIYSPTLSAVVVIFRMNHFGELWPLVNVNRYKGAEVLVESVRHSPYEVKVMLEKINCI